MKLTLLFINLFIFALIFSACQQKEKKSELSFDIKELQVVGDSLSNALLIRLKGELVKAIKDSGIVSAIRVCNTKALPLTDEVSRLTEYSVKIKRTSSRYRNPQNTPDKDEEAALQYFEKLYMDGKPLPEKYLQTLERDGGAYYKYYKPLQVDGLCLNCHGDPQQMNPEVIAIIDELYPEDLARGYRVGDFRGLVSITFDKPESSL